MAPPTQSSPHRVVVVGGGFGGLQACLKLARLPVEVTLVDRRNFHLFQPLAYQVATGAVSPAEICYPLRRIFRRRRNVRVDLAEVAGFDLAARRVALHDVALGTAPDALEYDTLIVSGGSQYSYFGHDEWQQYAAELKSLEGALTIRRRILEAFEAAELEPDPERQAELLTFVVVGAGPTGVEMAGQIAEIAHDVRGDFRSFDPKTARILLVEALDRVLTTFPESLSAKALRSLENLGVTGRLGESVVDVDAQSVTVQGADEATERIPTRTGHLGRGRQRLTTRADARRAGRGGGRPRRAPDRAGRPLRARASRGAGRRRHGQRPPARRLGARPARRGAGRPCSRAAMRRASVADHLAGRDAKPFHYTDKGNLATIGRAPRGGRRQGRPPQWLPGVGHVARGPPLVPHRLPEPPARRHPLGGQLLLARSRRAPDRPRLMPARHRARR
jgi:NADH dehydrogenase